jgi:hypothetical protein
MWLGATCAVLAWLGFGALTDLGKVPELLYPIAIGVALTGALVTLTPARQVVWWTTAITIVVFCVVTLTPFVTIALPTKKLVRNDKLPTR